MAEVAATSPTNARGIPQAPFVDDVESFVSSRADIEPSLKKFQEMIAKYQFMELNTQRRAQSLTDKIPEIRKTLETVGFLQRRKGQGQEQGRSGCGGPLETTVELHDTLYARVQVDGAPEEVYLWLGANVMLAYPIAEARTLLQGKLASALESLRNCQDDLDFLRQQITTLEVNTARLYNYEVTLKRQDRLAAEEGGK